jgi:replicative DNA helicase
MSQSMPHSLEAEREVLGTVLVDPGLASLFLAHTITAESFYHSSHRDIARAVLAMASSGQPIDEVSLKVTMERSGTWTRQTWLMLASLMDKASVSTSLPYYMDLVLEYETKRRLANYGMDISRAAHNGETATETLVTARTGLRDIESEAGSVAGVGMREGLRDALSYTADVMEGRVAHVFVPTGLGPLDEFLGGGLKAGHMVVINTASGHGKTAFAVSNLALAAARAGVRTAVFSLEMTPRRVFHRMLAADSAVPVMAQTREGLDPHDYSKMTYSADRLCGFPLDVYGTKYNSAEAIRGICEQIHDRHGSLGLVVVDYLQLLRSPNPELGSSDHGAISENMTSFRELSNELECVCALLSQPTVSQRRTANPPSDADTKGGGSISEAADLILTPWLPTRVDEELRESIGPGEMLPAEMYIRKNRDGETGMLSNRQVCFDRARMTFREV